MRQGMESSGRRLVHGEHSGKHNSLRATLPFHCLPSASLQKGDCNGIAFESECSSLLLLAVTQNSTLGSGSSQLGGAGSPGKPQKVSVFVLAQSKLMSLGSAHLTIGSLAFLFFLSFFFRLPHTPPPPTLPAGFLFFFLIVHQS